MENFYGLKKIVLNQFSVSVALSDPFKINYLDLYKVCGIPEMKNNYKWVSLLGIGKDGFLHIIRKSETAC